MQQLQFPTYEFRFKNRENKLLIFDIARKKFVILTPEEWVRQHVIHFLNRDQNIPLSMINAEKQISLHHTKKRFDVVVFKSDGSIFLVVECKAADVPITQATFDQVARYNLSLDATYIMVTNGIEHYYGQIDSGEQRYHFLRKFPNYNKK